MYKGQTDSAYFNKIASEASILPHQILLFKVLAHFIGNLRFRNVSATDESVQILSTAPLGQPYIIIIFTFLDIKPARNLKIMKCNADSGAGIVRNNINFLWFPIVP